MHSNQSQFLSTIILGSLLSIVNLCAFSQSRIPYDFLETDTSKKDEAIELLTLQYETDIVSLPDMYTKQYKESYTRRYEILKKKFHRNNILFNQLFEDYFNKILDHIIESNPELRDLPQIRLYISRDPWPNALSFGEGSVLFNLGLIRYLENESQIAFVICHEIAHLSLDHSNNSIAEEISFFNDKETKKEVDKIVRSKYNRRDQALSMIKKYSYSTIKHSRFNESAADSFGLQLLSNTEYDTKEALRVLEILDSVDVEKYNHRIPLEKIFGNESFPFQDRWLYKNEGLVRSENTGPFEEDSLKTHPECAKRIELLQGNIKTGGKKFIQDSTTFYHIVTYSDFQMIESGLHYDNYGYAMYHALLLHKKYPDNQYLWTCIGISLNKLYESRDDYVANRFFSMSKQKFDENYQEVLRFINNLRISEIAKISYHFFSKYGTRNDLSEEFLYNYYKAAKYGGEIEDMANIKNQCMDKFPEGDYINKF